MTLKELLIDSYRDYTKPYLKCTKITNGYELSYGKMYEPPIINFATLLELSKMFGTTSIDVDNYSQSGCDSCDWGSDYGHTIQILNPTKNTRLLDKLIKNPIQ